MAPSTPFDSTVTVIWDMTQPVQALLDVHSQVMALDRALEQSVGNAGSWAVRFTSRIGLVHDSFLQVIGDIGAMNQAMSKAGSAPAAGSLQGSGAMAGYSSARLPENATFGGPPPGFNGTASDWAYVQSVMARGEQGLSPTVTATQGLRMQLISSTGGFSLASSGQGYSSPFDTTGFTGDAKAGLLQANLGQAQSVAAKAMADMKLHVPGAEQDYKDAIESASGYRKELEAMTLAGKENAGIFDQMGNSMLRHIGIIAQAAVMWGTFQAAQQFLKQMITDVQQLEATSARLSFINPGISAGAQYAQAASYGVGMSQAAGGILTGAQGGATAAQRNQAGQLAEIFGADQYGQALTELIQTQKRADDAGLEHVSVMNYIATAYKTAPGDMKSYFDALQLGVTLHRELGLTAEQTGLMLLQSSAALGQSPDQIANVLERVQLRLAQAKVQQDLAAQYGIKGTDPTDLLKQVSARVAADPSGSQGLMTFLTQGLGIQGPRTLLDLTTALVEFNKAATASAEPLSNINDLTSTIDKTGTQAFQNLKASADAFLASLIQIEAQKDPLQVVLDLLNPGKALGAGYNIATSDANAMAKALQQQSDVNAYQTATGKSPYNSDASKSLGPAGDALMGIIAMLGGPSVDQTEGLGSGISGLLNFINPHKNQAQYTPEYLAWLAGQNGDGGIGGSGALDPRGPDRSMFKSAPKVTDQVASPFGGFQDLPKSFDWGKFQADLKKYSAELTKDVPAYVQNPQEVAFWDASKGYYRTATADSQVIQRAMKEQTDALKQVTGVFNVPSTGEVLVPFFALQAGMVPSTDPRARGGAASRATNAIQGNTMTNEERNRSLGIDPNYVPGGLDQGQMGVMGYLKAHGFSPLAAGGAQGRNTAGLPDDPRREAISQHRDALSPTINISMRNVVVLNSRVIYDEMVHQMQSQLAQARRGVGGGAGSAYAIG